MDDVKIHGTDCRFDSLILLFEMKYRFQQTIVRYYIFSEKLLKISISDLKHAALVHSSEAHARIVSIDPSEALAVEGVLAYVDARVSQPYLSAWDYGGEKIEKRSRTDFLANTFFSR